MDKSIRPPMYDYVQARIKERALEAKHAFLTDDERENIRKLYQEPATVVVPEVQKIEVVKSEMTTQL